MLRITIHDEAATTRFVIEGKLAGPWVEELEKCWQTAQSAAPGEPGRSMQVHLADVIFVDDPGKELLAAMHRQGVNLLANGLMTQAIVKEIVATNEESKRKKEKGNNQKS